MASRMRAGCTASADEARADDGDASLVVDAVELALTRFDDAIDDLPPATDIAFPPRAAEILADLRKLEVIAARAVRHTQGSPVVMRALGTIRRRYDELMLRSAAAPGATLG